MTKKMRSRKYALLVPLLGIISIGGFLGLATVFFLPASPNFMERFEQSQCADETLDRLLDHHKTGAAYLADHKRNYEVAVNSHCYSGNCESGSSVPSAFLNAASSLLEAHKVADLHEQVENGYLILDRKAGLNESRKALREAFEEYNAARSNMRRISAVYDKAYEKHCSNGGCSEADGGPIEFLQVANQLLDARHRLQMSGDDFVNVQSTDAYAWRQQYSGLGRCIYDAVPLVDIEPVDYEDW